MSKNMNSVSLPTQKIKFDKICYGGDYTPEHWPSEVMTEDMLLMKKAGVNMVTINVFSWGQIQPDEDVWEFDWLDNIMDTLAENNIYADLGTATASTPAWMARKYPEILPIDENGIRFNHGSRQTFNPNSPIYLEFNRKLVRKVAERYKNHPALALWHVNNELSHQVNYDYSVITKKAFQNWCKKKFVTLEALNKAWGLAFWGNTVFEWVDVSPPMKTAHQVSTSLLLDWKRFTNDAYLELYITEAEILREITPDIPITTNFLYEFKTLDYFSWADHIDIISVSSFPDPKVTNHPAEAALSHDIMRGLKDQPFLLLEQAPSQVNWRLANVNKRPGVMRLWSYQAMAHGSDGFLFFQWRASSHGSEKFHSAMVPHIGENSRVFREISGFGKELSGLNEIIGSDVQAEVGIILDYNNWWTCEFTPGPTALLDYLEMLKAYHYPLFDENITTDFIPIDRDFSKYKVIIAPLLYMIKSGFKEAIETFVANGGTFVTTFFSGVVDENDSVFKGGYPGPLTNLLGIKVEEFDALKPYNSNQVIVEEESLGFKGNFESKLWCDILQPQTAKTLATYGNEYYKDSPAVTVNSFGKGKAYYVATKVDGTFLKPFLKKICQDQGIEPILKADKGIEVTIRKTKNSEYLFLLNHDYENVQNAILPLGNYKDLISSNEFSRTIEIQPLNVAILRKL